MGAVGGDHSISFGIIQAHAEKYPGLGVLHLDAHADLRDAYEGFTWSHASIMYNVVERIPGVKTLVQVGIRDIGEAEHQLHRGAPTAASSAFFDADAPARSASTACPGTGRWTRSSPQLPAARVPVLRHRRARPRALPAHRHAGARRPVLPRGHRADRRRRALGPDDRRLRSRPRWRPIPTAASGTATSARGCSTR